MLRDEQIDAQIAERFMDWQWVQPPKHDYNGPLPEQGPVLVSPWLVSAINRGDYQWPPEGVIPPLAFIERSGDTSFSSDLGTAWQIVEWFRKKGMVSMLAVELGAHYIPESLGYWDYHLRVLHAMLEDEHLPLTICHAALKAVSLK